MGVAETRMIFNATILIQYNILETVVSGWFCCFKCIFIGTTPVREFLILFIYYKPTQYQYVLTYSYIKYLEAYNRTFIRKKTWCKPDIGELLAITTVNKRIDIISDSLFYPLVNFG